MTDETKNEKTVELVYQRWQECNVLEGSHAHGYSLHLTMEDRERYVATFWRTQRAESLARGIPADQTPETYVTCDGKPIVVESDSAVGVMVMRHGGSYRGHDTWTRVDDNHRLLTRLTEEPMPPTAEEEVARTGMYRALESEVEEIVQQYETAGADSAVVVTALLSVIGSRLPEGLTNDDATKMMRSMLTPSAKREDG